MSNVDLKNKIKNIVDLVYGGSVINRASVDQRQISWKGEQDNAELGANTVVKQTNKLVS